MKIKNIWIWNHYATNMFESRGGRHYWFAEKLIQKGYNVTVFCANTIHNSDREIEIKEGDYTTKSQDGIDFVFVKTPAYAGNGKKRLINMLSFYRKLFPVAKDFAKKNGKPDGILASSVHPLTLVAGIKIARKMKVPCVCEVRDLWPESLVAYGIIKRQSILAKILYQGEKWIYKKADYIIMTWKGGRDYIIERGWQNIIDLNKVYFISNGVDLEKFDRNSDEYQQKDEDLDNKNYKNIVYTGSIRKVNNIGMLLDAAKIIQGEGIHNIRFLIYGTGDEMQLLKDRCSSEEIKNVFFKGSVGKEFVPYILKNAYINILHNTSTILDKYGQSQNKLFEYLAAGKCIIQTYTTGNKGEQEDYMISVFLQNPFEIAHSIIKTCEDDNLCERMGEKARKASSEYDINILTERLVGIFRTIEGESEKDEII